MFTRPSCLAFALLAPAACAPVDGSSQPAPRAGPASEAVLVAAPGGELAQPATSLPDKPCPVEVSFGSFAAGIDREAFELVQPALREDPRVASVAERPWGREGELDLCVSVRSPADARPLALRLAGLIPAPPRRGFTEVSVGQERISPPKTAR